MVLTDEEKEWLGGEGQEDLRLCDSLCLPAARLIRIEASALISRYSHSNGGKQARYLHRTARSSALLSATACPQRPVSFKELIGIIKSKGAL